MKNPRRAASVADPSAPATLQDVAGEPLTDGRARQALKLALRVLDLAGVFKRPHDMVQSLTQVARALKALDSLDSAEGYLEQALHWAASVPGHDVHLDLGCELAELSCTLAEQQRDRAEHDRHAGMAARDRARARALEVGALAGRVSDAHCEAKLLLRVSDVLDRCGDHDHATSLQNRAVALMGIGLHEPSAEPAQATPQSNWEQRLLAPSSTLLM
ncbi:MAG: hypothetical protein HUU30_16410 [Burkholderiaceae bacterium]|nr:hypothetical protein [Burkholderiaceae bacterium]